MYRINKATEKYLGGEEEIKKAVNGLRFRCKVPYRLGHSEWESRI